MFSFLVTPNIQPYTFIRMFCLRIIRILEVILAYKIRINFFVLVIWTFCPYTHLLSNVVFQTMINNQLYLILVSLLLNFCLIFIFSATMVGFQVSKGTFEMIYWDPFSKFLYCYLGFLINSNCSSNFDLSSLTFLECFLDAFYHLAFYSICSRLTKINSMISFGSWCSKNLSWKLLFYWSFSMQLFSWFNLKLIEVCLNDGKPFNQIIVS